MAVETTSICQVWRKFASAFVRARERGGNVHLLGERDHRAVRPLAPEPPHQQIQHDGGAGEGDPGAGPGSDLGDADHQGDGQEKAQQRQHEFGRAKARGTSADHGGFPPEHHSERRDGSVGGGDGNAQGFDFCATAGGTTAP